MSTRRITVEEVLEAARKANIRLRRGTMYDRQKHCGCAQGALLLAEGFDDEYVNTKGYLAINERYGYPYAANFRNAFDDYNHREMFYCDDWTTEERERAILGFADGQAVAAAVFQKQGAQA
jgi:hypothetical protein